MMEQSNDLKDYFIIKNGRKLRYGYTTGSCAAAAAKAAAILLLTGNDLSSISLMTPRGIQLSLPVGHVVVSERSVSCAVKKDAGDDPDATDGIDVFAEVRKTDTPGIVLDGGKGVGRVTKKGLEQPVGEAAINAVPRRMILREVEQVCDDCGYEGGLLVTISVPEGEEIAQKTFNPRLGIVGGISILGTSGIVVPMSEEALIRSIEIEMRMRVSDGDGYLLMTPGNYGEAYLREHMELDFSRNIKCSNYVGASIDMAVNLGVKGVLFVSHIGKFVKVAAGIMHTHSRDADGRAEVMAANALRAGASADVAREILDTVTTDEALAILEREKIREAAMQEMLSRISYYMGHRSCGAIVTGAVLFSNEYGFLGQTECAGELIRGLRGEMH